MRGLLIGADAVVRDIKAPSDLSPVRNGNNSRELARGPGDSRDMVAARGAVVWLEEAGASGLLLVATGITRSRDLQLLMLVRNGRCALRRSR